jgi:hypothetical protein
MRFRIMNHVYNDNAGGMEMKRKLLIALAALLVVIVIIFIFRDFFIWKLIALVIKPPKGFDEIATPPAPDYSRPEYWAALPDRKDNADVVPAGDYSDNQDNALIDIFFLHPTTYYSRKAWNQPLDDKRANDYTDNRVLRNQASVFNGSGRIYAPRYRQATLYSFMDEKGNGERALELAYADVRKAFEYYLEHYNEGRPIIVASHSQGSRHAIRLLQDYFTGTPLVSQLVAAYLVGWGGADTKSYERFPDIPVCDSPDQTGCWMTWNTLGPEAERDRYGRSSVCVNPLTWTIDNTYASPELNLGGVVFGDDNDTRPIPDVGVVDAQCVDGVLITSRPEGEAYSYMPMGKDNYHIYDYGLFYINIRKNVEERVTAYLNGLIEDAAE